MASAREAAATFYLEGPGPDGGADAPANPTAATSNLTEDERVALNAGYVRWLASHQPDDARLGADDSAFADRREQLFVLQREALFQEYCRLLIGIYGGSSDGSDAAPAQRHTPPDAADAAAPGPAAAGRPLLFARHPQALSSALAHGLATASFSLADTLKRDGGGGLLAASSPPAEGLLPDPDDEGQLQRLLGAPEHSPLAMATTLTELASLFALHRDNHRVLAQYEIATHVAALALAVMQALQGSEATSEPRASPVQPSPSSDAPSTPPQSSSPLDSHSNNNNNNNNNSAHAALAHRLLTAATAFLHNIFHPSLSWIAHPEQSDYHPSGALSFELETFHELASALASARFEPHWATSRQHAQLESVLGVLNGWMRCAGERVAQVLRHIDLTRLLVELMRSPVPIAWNLECIAALLSCIPSASLEQSQSAHDPAHVFVDGVLHQLQRPPASSDIPLRFEARTVEILKVLRRALRSGPCQRLRALLVELHVFPALCLVLNNSTSIDEDDRLQLCTAVLRVLVAILGPNAELSRTLEEDIGFHRLWSSLFQQQRLTPALVQGVLEFVVGAKVSLRAFASSQHHTVRNVVALSTFLTWLPQAVADDPALFPDTLARITALSTRTHMNLTRCCDLGLLAAAIDALQSWRQPPPAVIDELLQLIEQLATHSLATDAMAKLLRALHVRAPDFSLATYLPLQRLMSRVASAKIPSYSFDLHGLDSALRSPKLRPIGTQGYTFHTWIRLDSLTALQGNPFAAGGDSPDDPPAVPSPASSTPTTTAATASPTPSPRHHPAQPPSAPSYEPRLFAFQTQDGSSVDAFFTAGRLAVTVQYGKGGSVQTAVFGSYPFPLKRWLAVTLVHVPTRGLFSTSTLALYVDGEQIEQAALKLPPLAKPVTCLSVGNSLQLRSSSMHSSSMHSTGDSAASPHALRAQVASFYLLEGVNEAQVAALAALSPNYRGIFDAPSLQALPVHDLEAAVAAGISGPYALDVVLPEPARVLVDSRVADKVLLAASAKLCDGSFWRNQACTTTAKASLGGDVGSFNGSISVHRSIQEVLHTFGGLQSILFLAEQIDEVVQRAEAEQQERPADVTSVPASSAPAPPLAPTSPRSPTASTFTFSAPTTPAMEICDVFLQLLADLMQHTPDPVWMQVRTLQTASALLSQQQSVAMGLDGLMAVQRIMKIRSPLAEIQRAALRHLLFNFRLWRQCKRAVRFGHIQLVRDVVRHHRRFCRSNYGLTFFFDALVLMCAEQTEGLSSKDREVVEDARRQVLSIIQLYLEDGLSTQEFGSLIQFCREYSQPTRRRQDVPDDELHAEAACTAVCAVLAFIWRTLKRQSLPGVPTASATAARRLDESFTASGPPLWLYGLLKSPDSRVRAAVLRLVAYFCHDSPQLSPTDRNRLHLHGVGFAAIIDILADGEVTREMVDEILAIGTTIVDDGSQRPRERLLPSARRPPRTPRTAPGLSTSTGGGSSSSVGSAGSASVMSAGSVPPPRMRALTMPARRFRQVHAQHSTAIAQARLASPMLRSPTMHADGRDALIEIAREAAEREREAALRAGGAEKTAPPSMALPSEPSQADAAAVQSKTPSPTPSSPPLGSEDVSSPSAFQTPAAAPSMPQDFADLPEWEMVEEEMCERQIVNGSAVVGIMTLLAKTTHPVSEELCVYALNLVARLLQSPANYTAVVAVPGWQMAVLGALKRRCEASATAPAGSSASASLPGGHLVRPMRGASPPRATPSPMPDHWTVSLETIEASLPPVLKAGLALLEQLLWSGFQTEKQSWFILDLLLCTIDSELAVDDDGVVQQPRTTATSAEAGAEQADKASVQTGEDTEESGEDAIRPRRPSLLSYAHAMARSASSSSSAGATSSSTTTSPPTTTTSTSTAASRDQQAAAPCPASTSPPPLPANSAAHLPSARELKHWLAIKLLMNACGAIAPHVADPAQPPLDPVLAGNVVHLIMLAEEILFFDRPLHAEHDVVMRSMLSQALLELADTLDIMTKRTFGLLDGGRAKANKDARAVRPWGMARLTLRLMLRDLPVADAAQCAAACRRLHTLLAAPDVLQLLTTERALYVVWHLDNAILKSMQREGCRNYERLCPVLLKLLRLVPLPYPTEAVEGDSTEPLSGRDDPRLMSETLEPAVFADFLQTLWWRTFMTQQVQPITFSFMDLEWVEYGNNATAVEQLRSSVQALVAAQSADAESKSHMATAYFEGTVLGSFPKDLAVEDTHPLQWRGRRLAALQRGLQDWRMHKLFLQGWGGLLGGRVQLGGKTEEDDSNSAAKRSSTLALDESSDLLDESVASLTMWHGPGAGVGIGGDAAAGGKPAAGVDHGNDEDDEFAEDDGYLLVDAVPGATSDPASSTATTTAETSAPGTTATWRPRLCLAVDPTENFARMHLKTLRVVPVNLHRQASLARDSGGPQPRDEDFQRAKEERQELRAYVCQTQSAWQQPGDPLLDLELHSQRVELSCPCWLVRDMGTVPGILELSARSLSFFQTNQQAQAGSGASNFSVELAQLREVHHRRYNLRATGLELFLVDQSNFFLNFELGVRERVYTHITRSRPPHLTYSGVLEPQALLRRSGLTERWRRREVSNFEYLMQLNTIAGRSYNDLNQYPVFPWVLADYNSAVLDLSNPAVFRDLGRPVGAINEHRRAQLVERYEEFEDPTGTIPKFHYGTHYSNAAGVLYYLLRLEPHTSLHVDLQAGKFDVPDRLFHSLPRVWEGIATGTGDVKELIPEFFFLPEFLENAAGYDLGVLQTGERLGDVVLPRWADSAQDFVAKHRAALESEYVSQNLHKWIDLIFGCKQQGPAAEEAVNVFYHTSYAGAVDLDAIEDPVRRRVQEGVIREFGQTPTQLFDTPHPQRLSAYTAENHSDASAALFEDGMTAGGSVGSGGGSGGQGSAAPTISALARADQNAEALALAAGLLMPGGRGGAGGGSGKGSRHPAGLPGTIFADLNHLTAHFMAATGGAPVAALGMPVVPDLTPWLTRGIPQRLVVVDGDGVPAVHEWLPERRGEGAAGESRAAASAQLPFALSLDLQAATSAQRSVGRHFELHRQLTAQNVLLVESNALVLCGGAWDNSIKVLGTTSDFPVLFSAKGHRDVVTCLSYDPSGERLVASGCRDGTCMLWRLRVGPGEGVGAGRAGHGPDGRSNSAAPGAAGAVAGGGAGVGGGAGSSAGGQGGSGGNAGTGGGGAGGSAAAATSADSTSLANAGFAAPKLRPGDVVLEGPLAVLHGHATEVTSIQVLSELNMVVSGARSGVVHIHSPLTCAPMFAIVPGMPRGLGWGDTPLPARTSGGKPGGQTADGAAALAALASGLMVMQLVLTRRGSIICYSQRLPDASQSSPSRLGASHHQRGAAPGKRQHHLHVYSCNGRLLAQEPAAGNISDMVLSRTNSFLITAGRGGVVRIRSVATLELLQAMNVRIPICTLALSQNERHLLVGLRDGKLLIIVPGSGGRGAAHGRSRGRMESGARSGSNASAPEVRALRGRRTKSKNAGVLRRKDLDDIGSGGSEEED